MKYTSHSVKDVTLSCNPDETVKTALAKNRMKMKRVQKDSGEILTTPSVLNRLKEADQERSKKANKKGKARLVQL